MWLLFEFYLSTDIDNIIGPEIHCESKAVAKHRGCGSNSFRNCFASSMAGSARLWPSLFAGTGNEYFRLAGCPEVYNFIGFTALLADLPLCCLPVHEPNHPMAGTEIGKSASCTVYQRCFVLSACVA